MPPNLGLIPKLALHSNKEWHRKKSFFGFEKNPFLASKKILFGAWASGASEAFEFLHRKTHKKKRIFFLNRPLGLQGFWGFAICFPLSMVPSVGVKNRVCVKKILFWIGFFSQSLHWKRHIKKWFFSGTLSHGTFPWSLWWCPKIEKQFFFVTKVFTFLTPRIHKSATH